MGPAAVPDLVERLKGGGPEAGRLHALWALDAIGGAEARRAIGSALADGSAAGPPPGGALGRHPSRPGCPAGASSSC